MVLREETIETIVAKYIKDGDVLAFGTSGDAEIFIKKIALKIEEEGIAISVVPTSMRLSQILSELKIAIEPVDGREIDLAIEFVDLIDAHFNFIKRDSYSLVRDKMIAQSAAELVTIAEGKNFVKKLHGSIPFEIAPFGWKRTLIQLEKLGEAKLRTTGREPFKTETGHYIVDVKVDEIYSSEDLDYQAKDIPGVLETGLFIGYADRVILHDDHKIQVKSRLDFEKQSEESPDIKAMLI